MDRETWARDETQEAFDAIIDACADQEALTQKEMQDKLKTMIVLDGRPELGLMETAQEDGDSWWLQEWETFDMSGHTYWRSGSAYSIHKAWVRRLAQAQGETRERRDV